MKIDLTKTAFVFSETKINEILTTATGKGGFDKLSAAESKALAKHTKIVEGYEAEHYKIPLPETIEGLIALKMYEKKLKQKDLA